MFKSAATKIAHNSTIPALAGNQELRPLQDLITAEKALLLSLQRLNMDFSKSSETLRTWAISEGDDLADIIGASVTILNNFSAALSQYATHGHGIREQLKVIRTREENLEEIKRRRRNVFRKADDAEKKLSRMGPEHKNLSVQNDLLSRLQIEIRSLDTDLMVEEAALGDFKRSASKAFMGLKFGALLDCCQKGIVTANFGNMIISEISEEKTQPGLHRAFYQGHGKMANLVAEATRAFDDPATGLVVRDTPQRSPYQTDLNQPGQSSSSSSFAATPTTTTTTTPGVVVRDFARPYPIDNQPGPSSFPPARKPVPALPLNTSSDLESIIPPLPLPQPFVNDIPPPPSPKSVYRQRQDSNPWSRNQSSTLPAVPFPNERSSSFDDFGRPRSNTGPMDLMDGPGGRFATFPVKARRPSVIIPAPTPTYNLDLPFQTQHDLGPDFASSIAEAFDRRDNTSDDTTSATAAAVPALNPIVQSTSNLTVSSNPWNEEEGLSHLRHHRKSNLSDNDDAVLAYLVSGDEGYVEKHNQQRLPPQPPIMRDNPASELTVEEDRRLSGSSTASVTNIIVEYGDGPVKGHERNKSIPSSVEDEQQAGAAASTPDFQQQQNWLPFPPGDMAAADRERKRDSNNNNDEHEHEEADDYYYHHDAANRSDESGPLAPPSAPFARRSVSPHPMMMVGNSNTYHEPMLSSSLPPMLGAAGGGGGIGGDLAYPVPSVGLGQQQQQPESRYSPPRFPPLSSRLPLGNSPLGSSGLSPMMMEPSPISSTRTIAASAFKRPKHISMENLNQQHQQHQTVSSKGPKVVQVGFSTGGGGGWSEKNEGFPRSVSYNTGGGSSDYAMLPPQLQVGERNNRLSQSEIGGGGGGPPTTTNTNTNKIVFGDPRADGVYLSSSAGNGAGRGGGGVDDELR